MTSLANGFTKTEFVSPPASGRIQDCTINDLTTIDKPILIVCIGIFGKIGLVNRYDSGLTPDETLAELYNNNLIVLVLRTTRD